MTVDRTNDATPRKPLRLWPGLAAALLVLVGFVLPIVVPETMLFGLIGQLVGVLAVVVWWMFFSQAPWSERLAALALATAAVAATRLILHESIATAGMGIHFYIHAITGLSVAFVAWAAATRRLAGRPRRTSMAATILVACGAWALLRTGGVTGEGDSDFHWRWSKSPEERLLAEARDEAKVPAPAPAPGETPKAPLAALPATKAVDEPAALPSAPALARTAPAAPSDARPKSYWPGFRGAARDGVVRGVRIEADWSRKPPVALWRRAIGPGWSSFAVSGDRVYTQEQRGDDELVSCYLLTTGAPVWRHRDPVRFWESNGGAGPRATPTLHDGRVYTFGATGIVNALDAGSGAVVWSRNAATDTGVKIPEWGFASSPLVIDDLVVVAASGQLAAYDAATGDRRWTGPTGGAGYSSPHLATIDGVPQILLLRGSRTISVAAADGTLLWEHTWQPGTGIMQPGVTAEGDVLITAAGDTMGGIGMRRVAVSRGPSGWKVEERWTSTALKPYFNDFVVHEGHAFGFDGSILACIDLADGKRKWKGGRYGHGQLVLLPDQDLLLVLSEEGKLALVGATADKFAELAQFPAIQGKTWNHPVLVGDVLLVRNGEEMAAFRLPLAASLSMNREDRE